WRSRGSRSTADKYSTSCALKWLPSGGDRRSYWSPCQLRTYTLPGQSNFGCFRHGCAPILLVEVVFFLFWPDNLNEYRHSDRRHCEPTTARSGVAPGRAVPSDRESRRFSPGHHFRELSQMR